jgi:acetyltransferase-like isoleucine patch superfamily enzyme
VAVPSALRRLVLAVFRRIEASARAAEAEELTRRFATFGKGSRIGLPAFVGHPEHISIGRWVSIRPHVRLEAVTDWAFSEQRFEPRLEIDDGVMIEHFAHIGCNRSVRIGKYVGIGSRAYVTDHVHRYDDPDVAPARQPVSEGEPVVLEEGVFIGEGVVVLPGVTIGRHTVVGANAVVTKSLPEFSVAAGAPARVVRRYDFESRQWRKP